ncbi:hypothetical protein [Streptomyces sp. NBC_01314]|nr:hypothetical protein OG622_08985 [Streptomyces sp. NBC_01314]WRZ54295.1 hypothetical protein OG622_49525 [Streptomyces sp. NBC_01314]
MSDSGRDSTTGSEGDISRLGFFLGARVACRAAVFRAGRAALAA